MSSGPVVVARAKWLQSRPARIFQVQHNWGEMEGALNRTHGRASFFLRTAISGKPC